MVTWTKHPRNPLLTQDLFGGTRLLDWRDPFVFREGRWWYLVTGGHREGGRGCLSLFRSPDLERWEFVGIPIEGDEDNWECPALFRLGDRWALVYSPHQPVKYSTGAMDFDRCRFTPGANGQFDYGRWIGLYAATVMRDANGDMILWGWMYSDQKERGWNGCLALPRLLRLLPDGKIGQQPAPALEILRRDPQTERDVTVGAAPRRYTVPGGCAELRLARSPPVPGTVPRGSAADKRGGSREAPLSSGTGSGFALWLRDRRGTVAEIRAGAGECCVAGDTLPAAELGEHGPAEVRVFVDRSLLEVFIDGRLSVSRWLDTDAVETFELFAERGSVELDRVEVWRLEEAGNGAAP